MAYLDDVREAGRRKLETQRARALAYYAYYDGDGEGGPVILDTEERQTFRRLLRQAGANWSALIVNATAERLQVDGFRFGAASDAAWAIWQANSMDADGELVQTDALVTGATAVLVQPDETNPAGVAITGESPLEAVVLYEGGSRRDRLGAYKAFTDDLGVTTEVVVLPDVIATWVSPRAASSGEPQLAGNPGGVTMIEVVPNPRMVGAPRSELDPAIPFVDRIETTIWDRLVATDYGAFRQIYATGIKLAREQIAREQGPDGQPVEGGETVRYRRPFDVGADRLLVSENPASRFGVIPESSLAGYLSAVEQDVTHLAAITQTPPHYMMGGIVNVSADAVRAAEAGLVSKVRRRSLHIGEAWEAIMRTALGMVGDPGAVDTSAEVVWHDFETRSEAQAADAAVKLATVGVPQEALWARLGASPQEVGRWRAMAERQRTEEAAAAAAAIGVAELAAALNGGPSGQG